LESRKLKVGKLKVKRGKKLKVKREKSRNIESEKVQSG